MQNYIQWIVKHRRWVLAGSLLVTVLLGANLGKMEVIVDPDRTLPMDHPVVQTNFKVEELFGNKFTVVIGVTPKEGTVFQPAVLAKVKAITSGILATPGVIKTNVLSLSAPKAKDIKGTADGLSVRPLMDKLPTTPEEAQVVRQRYLANPAYANSIVSKDEHTTVILAEFKKDAGGFKAIAAKVENVLAPQRDKDVEITLAGGPVFMALLETYSQRMGFLFPLAVLLIGIIHYEAFRTIQGLVLPLVTALLAVIWGLGIMSLAGVPLDAFNAATPILILAVAAGHAVQILKRYYEEYYRLRTSGHQEPKTANTQAVVNSLTKIGPVMLAAGFIGAASFMSLIAFKIQTVRTFGVFTGLGVLSALVIELTFIPALRAMLPPPSDKHMAREHGHSIWNHIVRRAAYWLTHYRQRIIIGAVAFTMLMGLGINQVKMDNSMRENFFASLQSRKDDAALNERMAGSNIMFVLVQGLEDDAIKNPDVLKAMDKTQQMLEGEPIVGKTMSIATFIKRINKAMNGDNPKFDVVPDKQDLIAQYLFLYSTSGEPGDFDSYVDYGYRNAAITAFVKTDHTDQIAPLKARLEAQIAKDYPTSVKVRLGGNALVSDAFGETMIRGKLMNMLQVAGVVFLISALLFRSALGGLLVLVPLTMTVVTLYGVMGFLGISLNTATATIAAMAVGLGADYAIYLTYRLREELRHTDDEQIALRETMTTAGKATLYVSSAVAGGYMLLMTSWGFNVHLWIGMLVSLSMVVSSVTALTLYPALLLWFRPRFVFAKVKTSADMAKASAVVGLLVLSAAASLMLMPGVSQAADPDARQIMEKNFVSGKFKDSVSDATFRLINANGQERVRESIGRSKLKPDGVDSMRVTRFVSPPDIKGTVSLLIENTGKDDDIWIYLPALKKVRRLVASNKKDSFVGTDFSYADVIGHKVDDWKHTLLKTEVVDGQPCYVIQSVPANPSVQENSGYAKRIGWIRQDSFVAVKGEAYDESGQLLKKITLSDIRQLDKTLNRWQPMRLEALNVQTGHRTVIEFKNMKVNQNVGDEFFTTRYMEREK